MPRPECEITRAPFEYQGDAAPHVMPCGHIFSLSGAKQVRIPGRLVHVSAAVRSCLRYVLCSACRVAF